ncbi:hypothetical protein [Flavobacterium sp. N1994]|uniref:hypothetical protein n=1 Tax=Flavobacterium sp. N1994 TaxID=2986827 RepID=UPI002223E847|nr:hypothetical protein [Flavobacterium sp. N1994]
MRKTLILLILQLVISNAFACSCKSLDFIQRFQTSEFIARAKIISIKDDKANSQYSIATIQILELFKGSKVTSIRVSKVSCPLSLNINTVWLLYASEEKGKYLETNGCSGSWQIEKIAKNSSETDIFFDRLIHRQLEMLRYLKKYKIQNENPYRLEFGFYSDCYKSFKGYLLKKTYAIYEVEISKNLSVKNIKEIRTFENKELSLKIVNCMHKNLIAFKRDIKSIQKPIKLLIAFYYFPAENGKKSSISISDEIIY